MYGGNFLIGNVAIIKLLEDILYNHVSCFPNHLNKLNKYIKVKKIAKKFSMY